MSLFEIEELKFLKKFLKSGDKIKLLNNYLLPNLSTTTRKFEKL